MDCPPGKIANVATGRCVHAHGRAGKAVLARLGKDKLGRRDAGRVRRPLQIYKEYKDSGYEYRFFTLTIDAFKRERWVSEAPDGTTERTPVGTVWHYDVRMPWGHYRVDVHDVNHIQLVYKAMHGETHGTVVLRGEYPKFRPTSAATARDIAFWGDVFEIERTKRSEQMDISTATATAGTPFGTPYPKRAEATKKAFEWSTRAYKDVCDAMRGVRPGGTKTKEIIRALKAYMKHSALVAPTMPKMMTVKRPVYLWRGVHDQVPPEVGSTVVSNGGCFTAFSHDKLTAEHFALQTLGGIIFRLRVDRIARGTPWIWMKAPGTPWTWTPGDAFWGVNRNTVRSDVEESEVLLPPGYHKVLSRSVDRGPLGLAVPLTVIDVAFLPLPGYTRKGALPKSNGDGRVATKTVGGDRLVLAHSNLAENVRVRRGEPERPPKRKRV